jgi:hypothetical protein
VRGAPFNGHKYRRTGAGDVTDRSGSPAPEDVDDIPTVTCSRCARSWDLAYELDELRVGNQAVEKFALDHRQHTGHFPDGVTPWLADCRQCPDGEAFLAERPTRRWAGAHARHTRHTIEIRHGDDEDPSLVEPDVD